MADKQSPELDDTLTYADGVAPMAVPDTGDLPAGAQVQRYVIIARIGAGGMGVVYAAHDSVLDRKVALKFLHGATALSKVRQERLLREAQVMARLRHPNVAAAYDVASFHGRVFVAMEYVEGSTLREWLRETRTWPAIRDMFLAAGRGLAAAHAAGIVHRDFKPENVLVGADGTPRVTDFGLARNLSTSTDPESADESSPTAASLTQTGAVLGTPRYMAPEQHLGGEVDATSDQFAFAVALYEAVHGETPYEGQDSKSIADNVIHGRRRAPGRGAHPARARKLLDRALRTDPSERFDDMNALLAELEPGRARWPWLVSGGALAAAAVLVALSLGSTPAPVGAPGPVCDGAGDRVAEVWNDDHRAAIAAAFDRAGTPGADAMARAFVGGLDQRLEGWSRMHRETCEATHVRGEQSADMLDQRMACLDTRLAEFVGLIDYYAGEPEVERLSRAPGALDKLPQLTACDASYQSGANAPLPAAPAARLEIARIDGVIASARARWVAGDYQGGRELLDSVREAADATDYAPVRARLAFELGQHLWALDDVPGSRAALESAAELAAEGGDGITEVNAWISLINVAGALHARAAEAQTYISVAKASVARVNPPGEVRGRFYNNFGFARDKLGDKRVALDAYLQAAELYRQSLGPNSPRRGLALANAGAMYNFLGERGAAEATLREGLEIQRANHGPDHPDLAYVHSSLASLSAEAGHYAASLERYQEALRLKQQHMAPTNRELAYTNAHLCTVLLQQAEYDRALEHCDTAVRVHLSLGDSDHGNRSQIFVTQAAVLSRLGRAADARDAIAKARRDWDRLPSRIRTQVLVGQGQVALAMGKRAQARQACARANDLALEDADNADPDTVIEARTCMARADRSGANTALLLSTLEGARAGASRSVVSELEVELIDALTAAGHADEAFAVAAPALAALSDAEGTDVARRDRIAGWLAEHATGAAAPRR